jgi:hypothetical protein
MKGTPRGLARSTSAGPGVGPRYPWRDPCAHSQCLARPPPPTDACRGKWMHDRVLRRVCKEGGKAVQGRVVRRQGGAKAVQGRARQCKVGWREDSARRGWREGSVRRGWREGSARRGWREGSARRGWREGSVRRESSARQDGAKAGQCKGGQCKDRQCKDRQCK